MSVGAAPAPLRLVPDVLSRHRYDLAIFDFDGTLADSGDWFLGLADHLADRFNFRHVNPDEVEALRGQSSRAVIKYLGIPRWKLPAMARYVHALLAQQTDKIALFDGVTTMIDTLHAAGIRLALVTSNSEDNARAILGPALAARFSQFECGASLFGKARRFRRVLKKTKVPIERALCIGDETRDIIAAHKVCIAPGAVLWGYANRDALAACEPMHFFSSTTDVLRLVLGEAYQAA